MFLPSLPAIISSTPGIYITASGAHNQTFQRSQSHGGIYTSAVLDRRYGRTVSKVAIISFKDSYRLAQDIRRTSGNVLVARASGNRIF